MIILCENLLDCLKLDDRRCSMLGVKCFEYLEYLEQSKQQSTIQDEGVCPRLSTARDGLWNENESDE